MPLRKKVSYVGLKDFDYLIRDTSLTSPDFFNIVHFPEKFKAGKNLFKLRAHPSNLVNFSEIFIEILDFNSNPVYYEPINYIEKDGTRVIAVYIYEDTPPDTCTVYLAGRTAVNPLTGETIPATTADRTQPNVLWSRNVTIAPDDRNDVEIIFTQYPSLVVSEVVQAYLQPTNVYNIFTQLTGSGGTMTITPAPSQVIGGLINNTLGGPAGPGTTTPQGAGSSGTPSFGDQFYNLSPTENTLALSNGSTALSPPLNTLTGYSLLTTSGFALSSQMEGGIIVVRQPNITIQSSTRGKSGLVYPNSQVSETNTNILGTTSQLSGSIKFAIVNVINSTQALVSQFDGFKNINDNTYGPFNIRLRKQLQGGQYVTYIANALQASSNFTASFIQPTATVLTQNSASFADIILTDIEPATGDVYKIKTLYKPSGFFGDFSDLGDTILEQTDLLIDTGSLETNVVIGSYYENYGRFDNLAEINQYWESSSYGTVTNPFAITYDTATLIGGARLLTDWSPSNQYIASIGDACIFNIRSQYRPSVTKNTEYLVKFRIANDTTIASYSSNDPNIPNARLDVYVSGSRVTIQEEYRYTQAGEIDTVPNINATLVENFRDNGPLGTRIGTYQIKHTPSSYGNVVFRFKAEDNGPIDLKFVTRRGSFILADIQLLADKETGYSPNYTRLSKRIPTEHLNTPLTFKFQYYDYRGNKADLESIAFGAVFDGDNTYIDGVNNLITGSIFLSNQTNSGIEMAGVSSGFIRTVGFNGIDAAIASTGSSAGFLLYSGSILRDISNEFISGGIGFQAMATTSSYIRVSDTDKELRIISPGFDLRTYKGATSTKFSGSVSMYGLQEFAGDRVLVTNAGGQIFYTSSAAFSGGSSATSPGGSDTQIQYNNASSFGGVPVLTYDGTTLRATGSFTGSFEGIVNGGSF
jgi:hypothetical protein